MENELLNWEAEQDARAECAADLSSLGAGWVQLADGSLADAGELAQAA